MSQLGRGGGGEDLENVFLKTDLLPKHFVAVY